MSNLTSTTDLTISGNLVCGGNSVLGSSSSNTLLVNSEATFYNTLNTNGIIDTGNITSTGNITCIDASFNDLTASGTITANSLTSPNFTGTATFENLTVTSSLTCNAGITLPTAIVTPTIGQLGYKISANNINENNRLITSGVVFNVNSITLSAGTYIISYRCSFGNTSNFSGINNLSHGLSSTSESQVAPTQIYDADFSLTYNDGQNYTISSTELRAFSSGNITYRLNVLIEYTQADLYALTGDELSAIRIA